MKRSKRLYGLLGVLAVVCIATVGVLTYEEKKEEIKNSGETVLAINPDDVTHLSWSYDSASYAFSRDEGWKYEEDKEFPVNEAKMTSLLEQFQEVKAAFVIENVDDYGQYGLDDPECEVSVRTKEKEYEILLGDFSSMDAQRYMSMGDGNVYLITEDPAEAFEISLSDMIAHDEIPALDQASEITFAGAKNYTITLEDTSITYSNEDLYYTRQDEKAIPLDTDKVEAYLDTIEGLGLTDYKTYKATEEDLASYGLAEPELTVTVRYPVEQDGESTTKTFTLTVGRDPEEAASTEDDEIIAYVRVGDSKLIYEITATEYKALVKAAASDLRHDEIFWAEFDSITQLEVTLEGETHTITADGKEEDITYKCGDKEIEITDLKSALTDLEVDQYTKEEPTGKEEIRLTIQLDHETVSQIELIFYRCDGSTCLACVDGEPTALVSRSQVVDLMEAVNKIVLE